MTKRQYQHNYYLKTHIIGNCKLCKNLITKHNKSGLCGSCSQKRRLENPKNNPNYKTGNSVKKYYECKDCGKKLSNNPVIRCKSCANKDKNKLFALALRYTPFWEISNGITLCKKCHKEMKKDI